MGIIDSHYPDCTVRPHTESSHPTQSGYTVLVYVIGGNGTVNDTRVNDGDLVLFADGGRIALRGGDEPLRFFFLSGKPIREPITRRGPIVMNTEEELNQAFSELQENTFLKPSSCLMLPRHRPEPTKL